MTNISIRTIFHHQERLGSHKFSCIELRYSSESYERHRRPDMRHITEEYSRDEELPWMRRYAIKWYVTGFYSRRRTRFLFRGANFAYPSRWSLVRLESAFVWLQQSTKIDNAETQRGNWQHSQSLAILQWKPVPLLRFQCGFLEYLLRNCSGCTPQIFCRYWFYTFSPEHLLPYVGSGSPGSTQSRRRWECVEHAVM